MYGNGQFIKTFVADDPIEPYSLVYIADTNGAGVVAPSEVGSFSIGVSGQLGADIDEQVDIVLDGIAEVKAGAAFSAGAMLTSDSNSAAIAASSGDFVVGIALKAAMSANETIPMLISKFKI